MAAQKVFAAKHEGRDPAAEKRQSKCRAVADRIEDLLESFIIQRLAQNRSAAETSRLLRREVGIPWAGRSVHSIGKRDVVDLISAIVQRGAPGSANKTLKSLRPSLGGASVKPSWIDLQPKECRSRWREVARDRVLDDAELAQVLIAARTMAGPYGGIVEFLALTAQRREEVAGLRWDEMDLAQRVWTIPKARTKNAKAHMVHLSKQALTVLKRADRKGPVVFTLLGTKPFQDFTHAKRRLDQLSGVTGWRLHDLRRTCVSGMARLGVAPHIADKILNHQAGTISGVAAVYQRHDFLAERRAALDEWGAHVGRLLVGVPDERQISLQAVA